jgi:hypothetical protein
MSTEFANLKILSMRVPADKIVDTGNGCRPQDGLLVDIGRTQRDVVFHAAEEKL